jgi:RNA polymerase sigma factor (sigma-70 family)
MRSPLRPSTLRPVGALPYCRVFVYVRFRLRCGEDPALPFSMVVGKRAQAFGTSYAGLGHAIPGRDEGDKLLREMAEAREQSAIGDRGARARFEQMRNRVCAGYLRFALVLSKRYLGQRGRLELEDLLQLAGLGLMRACETFEPDRGLAFSTYSANWVRAYVSRGIADHAKVIRVPSYVQVARGQCSRAAAKFAATTGRAPDVAELSGLTSLSPRATARAWTQTRELLSLDAPASDGDRETVGDGMPSDGPTPLDALLAKERAEYARASLASLPARERDVVERRSADAEMSLEEIGMTLRGGRAGRIGLCRERVRQIERDGFARLRRRADKGLRLDS